MNAALLLTLLMAGQTTGHDGPVGAGATSSKRPPELDGAGVTQKLGTALPSDAPLLDESGNNVTLRQYWGEQPIVFVLAYYKCQMLCAEVIRGLFESLPKSGLSPEQYQLVIVSFDPEERPDIAAQTRDHYLKEFSRPGLAEHVHFLTGPKSTLDQITNAVGFTYKFDARKNQYAHPGMITMLTPQGTIARYLFGVRFQPRDLRLALVEASEGKIGTFTDQIVLYCLAYDPNDGKYSIQIVRITSAISVVILVGAVSLALWRERKRRAGGVNPPRSVAV